MKELSIEEKAKRYDEAIKLAKDSYNYPSYPGFIRADVVFPELKESEDERIRKAIKYGLDHVFTNNTTVYETTKEQCLAWLEKHGEKEKFIKKELGCIRGYREEAVKRLNELEKQGEQKPVIEMKSPEESLGISSKEYNEIVNDCLYDESKPTDKVEPKFHKGDWVVVSTTKGDRVVQIASVEYFKDGYPSYTTTEGRWFGNGTKARLLTDKDVETITLPESKIIVSQKPAWSEEDEKKIDSIIETIRIRKFENPQLAPIYEGDINWLKSLKPQKQWKPSKEEMKALADALSLAKNCGEESAFDLRTLYEQLKKLTE